MPRGFARPNPQRRRPLPGGDGIFDPQLSGLRSAFARETEDIGPERLRLGTGISSAIAAKTPRVEGSQQQMFAGNLAQLLNKSKARAGIARRGEKAIEGQRLKDRLTLMRSDASRRGLALSAGQASRRARLGLDTALRGAKDQTSAALFGAAGSIAGGAAAGIAERRRAEEAAAGDVSSDEFFGFP